MSKKEYSNQKQLVNEISTSLGNIFEGTQPDISVALFDDVDEILTDLSSLGDEMQAKVNTLLSSFDQKFRSSWSGLNETQKKKLTHQLRAEINEANTISAILRKSKLGKYFK